MRDVTAIRKRGYALQRQGKLLEAEQDYRLILRERPNDAGALNALGTIALTKCEERTAELLFRRAIAAASESLNARTNLAALLMRAGRLQEAEQVLQPALRAPSVPVEIYRLLGKLFSTQRRHGEAIAAYRKALNAAPLNVDSQISYMLAKRHVCDWSDYEADEEAIRALAREGKPLPSLFLMSLNSTLDEQLLSAQRTALQFEHLAAKASPTGGVPPHRSTRGKIKIGYLSNEFHGHATSWLLCELIERHNRDRFTAIGYSYGPPEQDQMKKRISAAFDEFHTVYNHSSLQAAKKIRDDKIDILVDLKGYTIGARTKILALRPAPVQVNFLGFPGTMGATFIDYIIADPIVGPGRFQPYSVESIVQLPDCFQPNDTKREISRRHPSRSDCGLPDEAFVFAAFANPYKVTPSFFSAWMRLLQAVPGSVLWLTPKSELCAHNLRAAARDAGVDSDRLLFAPQVPQADHLARSRLADLFLDTLPVSAFTTASDAMWVGAPLVTCLGDTPAGRGGASVLTAMGIPELIAGTVQAYEELARVLALDTGRLIELRTKIRQQIGTSALFNIARYTAHLEFAYSVMHQRSREGSEATPFSVAYSASGEYTVAGLKDGC